METTKEKHIETVYAGKTPAEIEALKAKYGRVAAVVVEHPITGEMHHWWFRKLDMQTLSAATVHANNPMKMGQILFVNLLIDGDESVKDDADLFPAVLEQLSTMVKTAKATIKEF